MIGHTPESMSPIGGFETSSNNGINGIATAALLRWFVNLRLMIVSVVVSVISLQSSKAGCCFPYVDGKRTTCFCHNEILNLHEFAISLYYQWIHMVSFQKGYTAMLHGGYHNMLRVHLFSYVSG